MAKYLIVNADDYGMCNAANEAVEELFLGGWLKSSTIMMPCPGAEHAVEGVGLPCPFFHIQILCLNFISSSVGCSQQMSLMGCCFEG